MAGELLSLNDARAHAAPDRALLSVDQAIDKARKQELEQRPAILLRASLPKLVRRFRTGSI